VHRYDRVTGAPMVVEDIVEQVRRLLPSASQRAA